MFNHYKKTCKSWLADRKILDYNATQKLIESNSFDFSDSPDKVYYVKKHKCASTTFAQALLGYV